MKRIAAILLTAVLLAGFAACTAVPESTQPQSSTPESETQMPVYEGLPIETPIGTLVYPAEYAGNIRLETEEDDGLYSYTLFGTTGAHEALLFTLYVGERGEGRLFGFAPDKDGNPMPIYIQMVEFEGDETWEEQELELVWHMQQYVNNLIDQIYELPGFQE